MLIYKGKFDGLYKIISAYKFINKTRIILVYDICKINRIQVGSFVIKKHSKK